KNGCTRTRPRGSRRSRPTTRRTAARRSRCVTGWLSTRPRAPAGAGGRRARRSGPRPDGAPWAGLPEGRPVDDDRQKADAQREALRQALLAGAAPQSPRWLAAELLEYHRREARPAWWWLFTRCGMSLDELVEDGESIGRLEPQGTPRR